MLFIWMKWTFFEDSMIKYRLELLLLLYNTYFQLKTEFATALYFEFNGSSIRKKVESYNISWGCLWGCDSYYGEERWPLKQSSALFEP
jgi:hypothetical protein